MMKLLLLLCFYCAFTQLVASQSHIVRSTLGASGSSENIINEDNTYIIQQSIGQSSVIGTTINGDYIFRQGFIQPDVLSKIIEKDLPLNLEISIYPNPFEEQISLAFSDEIKNEIHVTVFNVLGAIVFSRTYQPRQQLDVSLGWLSSGEYILKAIANHKQFIAKIIKK